jgi:hypothetical protein
MNQKFTPFGETLMTLANTIKPSWFACWDLTYPDKQLVSIPVAANFSFASSTFDLWNNWDALLPAYLKPLDVANYDFCFFSGAWRTRFNNAADGFISIPKLDGTWPPTPFEIANNDDFFNYQTLKRNASYQVYAAESILSETSCPADSCELTLIGELHFVRK